MQETTKIWLYANSPFRNDYENVIRFSSVEEQDKFFTEPNNHINLLYHSDSFQQVPRNGAIQVTGRVEKFETATYMRFINHGRTYYAFIMDVIYLNEKTTEIYYEIDVWNTYYFDLAKTKVSGQVESMTLKNSIGSLVDSSQGFSTGTKRTIYASKVGNDVEWLVVVAKPTITLKNGKAKNINFAKVGTQKSFKYFIVPINNFTGRTYKFNIDGQTVDKSYPLEAIFQELYGLGAEDDTVNNIINIYVSRQIGIDYEFNTQTQTVTITGQNIREFELHRLGSSTTTTTTVVSSNQGISYNANGNYTGGAINYGGHSLSAEHIKTLVGLAQSFNVLPSLIISQLYYESNWGNSNVGRIDNNWGGLSGGAQTRPSGVKVTQGLARPANEGGHYMHFASVKDYFIDYMFLLAKQTAGNNQKMYQVAGKMDFAEATKGLFTVGGALFNYAEVGYTQYNATMQSVRNGINQANGGVLDKLDQQIKSGTGSTSTSTPQATPSTPKTDNALKQLAGLLGQRVGSGQCYGLVAKYSQILGGALLGGGVTGVNANGTGKQADGSNKIRGMSASNIGGDYNWQALGWQVVFNPTSLSQVKAGGLINWKPVQGYDLEYGHTGVIEAVNGQEMTILEQNYGGQWVTRNKRPIKLSDIESIVYPPEIAGGGTIMATSTGDVPTTTTTTQTVWNTRAVLLEVKTLHAFNPTTFEVPNLLRISYDNIAEQLKKYTGRDINPEIQLLNSEFTEIELYDSFGNSYLYQPQFLPRTLDDKRKYVVIFAGALGDRNQVHITFKDYNNLTKPDYVEGRAISKNVDAHHTNQTFVSDPERLKYGFFDTTGRDITILNDATASYMQANKNQNQAIQLSFKENKEIQAKQASLANKQVAQANKEATYNASYAVDSANINIWANGVSNAGGVIGDIFSGNIGGAVTRGLNAGYQGYQDFRAIGHAETQAGFAKDNNSLRSQANALANMQAKQALNQSIRSYNASMTDLQNQPISIQQIGNDLAFNTGYNADDVIYKISIAQQEILYKANEYIKLFGTLINSRFDNMLAVRNRKRFNYVKAITVTVKIPANQAHINAIQAIFQTGVRIWEYGAIKNDSTLFDYLPNNDNAE